MAKKTFEELIKELEAKRQYELELAGAHAKKYDIMRANDEYNNLIDLCWCTDSVKMQEYIDAENAKRHEQRLAREAARKDEPAFDPIAHSKRMFEIDRNSVEEEFEYLFDLVVNKGDKKTINETAKYLVTMMKECYKESPTLAKEYAEEIHEERLRKIEERKSK